MLIQKNFPIYFLLLKKAITSTSSLGLDHALSHHLLSILYINASEVFG